MTSLSTFVIVEFRRHPNELLVSLLSHPTLAVLHQESGLKAHFFVAGKDLDAVKHHLGRHAAAIWLDHGGLGKQHVIIDEMFLGCIEEALSTMPRRGHNRLTRWRESRFTISTRTTSTTTDLGAAMLI